MSPLTESLPAELLLEIVGCLTLGDISVLMQTCRKLFHDLEPSLYRSQQARDDALKWACTHGHLKLIRHLITVYESSPSAINRALTLNFAISGKRLDGFKLLLDLAARVDGPDESCRLNTLITMLYNSSTSQEYSHAFFKADQAAKLPLRLLDKLLMMLARQADAPIDLVHLVIGRGARVNETHSIGITPHKTWANPLSASILCNSRPVFDVLLERGASIHGTKTQKHRRMPLHVPIHAAAYSIQDHGTDMIQACLDNGADINQIAIIYSRPSSYRCRSFFNRYCHSYGTPLSGYLDSIKSWPVETNPIHHLQYLLDRGAILPDSLPMARFTNLHDDYGNTAAPHFTLHLLLNNMKNNLNQLADAQFQAVTKLLIYHGALPISSGQQATAEWIKYLLLEYDHRHRRITRVTYPVSEVQAWGWFITLLLDSASSPGDQTDNGLGQDTLDALLSEYIYARGKDPDNPPTDLTIEAISALISHGGADINARPFPALHRICHYYHLVEAKRKVPNDAYRRVHDNKRVLKQRRLLVELLVKKFGADPNLKVCVNGVGGGDGQVKTAEEILLDGLKSGEYTDAGRRFIEGLLEEIRKGTGSA